MKSGLLGLLIFALVPDAQAHRLDEYLQATRITVATNRIDLTIDLTPGVAVFDQLLLVIDHDHDRRVSESEATSYAKRVLRDIRAHLDKKLLKLTLVDIKFPPMSDARTGTGVIRLKAFGSIDGLAPGRHEFDLDNQHLPAISVYLVNALVPKDRAVKITRQTRNENQSNYRLTFTREPNT